jgi:hypothetical protein
MFQWTQAFHDFYGNKSSVINTLSFDTCSVLDDKLYLCELFEKLNSNKFITSKHCNFFHYSEEDLLLYERTNRISLFHKKIHYHQKILENEKERFKKENKSSKYFFLSEPYAILTPSGVVVSSNPQSIYTFPMEVYSFDSSFIQQCFFYWIGDGTFILSYYHSQYSLNIYSAFELNNFTFPFSFPQSPERINGKIPLALLKSFEFSSPIICMSSPKFVCFLPSFSPSEHQLDNFSSNSRIDDKFLSVSKCMSIIIQLFDGTFYRLLFIVTTFINNSSPFSFPHSFILSSVSFIAPPSRKIIEIFVNTSDEILLNKTGENDIKNFSSVLNFPYHNSYGNKKKSESLSFSYYIFSHSIKFNSSSFSCPSTSFSNTSNLYCNGNLLLLNTTSFSLYSNNVNKGIFENIKGNVNRDSGCDFFCIFAISLLNKMHFIMIPSTKVCTSFQKDFSPTFPPVFNIGSIPSILSYTRSVERGSILVSSFPNTTTTVLEIKGRFFFFFS